MFRGPSRQAVLAVRAVKAAAVMGVVGSTLALTLGGTSPSRADVDDVVADARCIGVAGKTIVRNRTGATRAVPFEHGWKVYRGEAPGTLVVVCPS